MTEYLTTSAYADRYGLNVQSVRRMCERGDVPAVKCGSVWRIPCQTLNPTETMKEIEELRRKVAALLEWKEKVCEIS